MSVIESTAGLAKAGSRMLLPYALVAAVALAVASALGGFYVGQQFEKGKAALAAVPLLKQENASMATHVDALRREALETQERFRNAALALELVRNRYEDAINEIDRIATVQNATLDAYIAANPDLSEPRIDADGVRLWNAAARGVAPAEPATASAVSNTTRPVSRTPAGTVGGSEHRGHSARVDSGGAPVSDVSREASETD